MFHVIGLLLNSLLQCVRSRRSLLLVNLALRQQLAVFRRKHPRPRLNLLDKLFWAMASRFWSSWERALLVVSFETVVRWHRAGFALYWRAISRARGMIGRKKIPKELRELIFRMGGRESHLGRTGFTASS